MRRSGWVQRGDPGAAGWPRRRFLRGLGGVLPLLPTAAWSALGEAAPVLRISTNNTPRDRKALELLSQEAFARIGRSLKLVSLPSERSLQVANQGEVDGEGLRIAGLSDTYPHLVQVPEPYVGVSFAAFAKGGGISLDQGWDSLRPHRVAFIQGWKLFEAHTAGCRIVHKVDRPEQMFEMLDSGRIDLALYTRADGVALARHMGLADIVPLSPSLKDVDMYLYLHRQHEALVLPLARALKGMKSDGSHKRIMALVDAA